MTVRDHIKEVLIICRAQPVDMVAGRPGHSALHDHPIARAGSRMAGSTVDVELLLPARQQGSIQVGLLRCRFVAISIVARHSTRWWNLQHATVAKKRSGLVLVVFGLIGHVLTARRKCDGEQQRHYDRG
jgi:hypothetical protein